MTEHCAPQERLSLVEELRNELHGKQQGYVKTIKVGRKLFPYCIPPQIEVVLLDPEQLTVVFRSATDPDSKAPKKSRWRIGSPDDVADCAIGWRESIIHSQRKGNRKS